MEKLITKSYEAPETVFDVATYKSIMRNFAASVTVITTASRGELHGMTATAFCSVCAEPPTVLIVVNRQTNTHPLIKESGVFVVNILSEQQIKIAEVFASSQKDKFRDVRYSPIQDGCPVLVDTAGYVACTVKSCTDVGSHTIFLGEVFSGTVSERRPLVYHSSQFTGISKKELL